MEEDQETVRGTVFPTTQLTSGLREGQIAQLIENDEVEAGHVVGQPALLAVAGLGFQPVHQIDDIEEASAGAVPERAIGGAIGPSPMASARATAMARWVLPVPVPPISTTLR